MYETDSPDNEIALQVMFFTSVVTKRQMEAAELMVESIREFGGPLRQSGIKMFVDAGAPEVPENFDMLEVEIVPMSVPTTVRGYALSSKVFACHQAERSAGSEIRSLVWIGPDCLVIRPPMDFILDDSCDAAIRPVHIRNVGMPVGEPLDGFWTGVMKCAGIEDTDCAVESFVDRRRIRAYFNSHSYSVRPSVGLFGAWFRCFEQLVSDEEYQSACCRDELHRIFLHQAILSALTVTMIPSGRIRILPATYSYPYNLHGSVPADARPAELGELTTVVYEDMSMRPVDMAGIAAREPLRSWLESKLNAVQD